MSGAGLDVTLVEASREYVSCPFSNHVVAGLRPMEDLRFGYGRVGVPTVHARATAVDSRARTVTVDGRALP